MSSSMNPISHSIMLPQVDLDTKTHDQEVDSSIFVGIVPLIGATHLTNSLSGMSSIRLFLPLLLKT